VLIQFDLQVNFVFWQYALARVGAQIAGAEAVPLDHVVQSYHMAIMVLHMLKQKAR
jgi:hypothetical protein